MNVNLPGDLMVECVANGFNAVLPISAPGRYQLDMGMMPPSNPWELRLVAQNGLDIELDGIGIHEKAYHNACSPEPFHGGPQRLELRRHVQSAFGSEFLTLLRNQTNLVRLYVQGDFHDFRRVCHLEVEARGDAAPQLVNIPILNMAPVLAQMNRDLMGSGLLAKPERLGRIRVRRAPGLAHRGHMVYVYR